MANRKIIFYEDHFTDFFQTLNDRAKRKVLQVFLWIQSIDQIPVSILKSFEGVKGLYEIRIEFESNIYRVFCCFDDGNIVVLFNAFQKKTQKTPKDEVEKAKRLMKDYFELKNSEE